MTRAANSLADQRDNGWPLSAGSVQASAVTCARTADEKKARRTAACRVLPTNGRLTAGAPLANRPQRTAQRARNIDVRPLRVLIGG
jgi:hypothetical protein